MTPGLGLALGALLGLGLVDLVYKRGMAAGEAAAPTEVPAMASPPTQPTAPAEPKVTTEIGRAHV